MAPLRTAMVYSLSFGAKSTTCSAMTLGWPADGRACGTPAQRGANNGGEGEGDGESREARGERVRARLLSRETMPGAHSGVSLTTTAMRAWRRVLDRVEAAGRWPKPARRPR